MADRTYSEIEVAALAREAYHNGTAHFPLDPNRSALLVIDMQDEFVKPGWTPYWVPEATRMVPRVQRLIADCRELKMPVIFTAFAATHLGHDRPKAGAWMPNRYGTLPGSDGWFRNGNIWHELSPEADDVVIFKPSYGAFYDTPLQTILRTFDRDTIIVVGTLTNFCCGTTARQGYERGFFVVVGSDVTATDDPAMQQPELDVLRKGFARVLTAAEIASELRSARPSDPGSAEAQD